MAATRIHDRPSLAPPPDVLGAIAGGGAIGAVARWAFSELYPVQWQQFPWATYAENISGSFLLGFAVAIILNRWSGSRLMQPFLCIGVLGSFTTFSNFSHEILTLVTNDRAPLAIWYMSGSVLCGLLAASLGILLGRACTRRRSHGRAAP